MAILEIHGLTMRFGGLTAVNKVDLAVAEGAIFSVIGPNGAGKTTLFNAVTGIYEPTEGSIAFRGRELRRPFGGRALSGVLLIALTTGLLAMAATHVQEMWKAGILDNFRFKQAFPWGTAVIALGSYVLSHAGTTAPSFVLGAVVGAAGAWIIWQRQRRSATVIARQDICRTFQNIRLFQDMTVLENVLVGMDRHLRTRFWHMALRLPVHFREQQQSEQKSRELLRFVGLGEEAGMLAKNLPYGDQRRLEIARALATQPKLLLLDEPAAGMNPAESHELMGLIHKIRDSGITVLLIEHHMKLVMDISDRIAVLDYGIKIAEGTAAEIQAHPRVIEAYLGKEEIS